jgi:tyrosyl-tRNA synthetase
MALIGINIFNMSVSAFHGGLEFSEPLPATAQSASLGQRDINEFFNPRPSTLSLEERYELCSSVGEEVLMPEELRSLLERKQMFRCYDGFEPSGRMHIA